MFHSLYHILKTSHIEIGDSEKENTNKSILRMHIICRCVYCKYRWTDTSIPFRNRICIWCTINIKHKNQTRRTMLKIIKEQYEKQKILNGEIREFGMRPDRILQTILADTIHLFMKNV